jgi:hypothetical protein
MLVTSKHVFRKCGYLFRNLRGCIFFIVEADMYWNQWIFYGTYNHYVRWTRLNPSSLVGKLVQHLTPRRITQFDFQIDSLCDYTTFVSCQVM